MTNTRRSLPEVDEGASSAGTDSGEQVPLWACFWLGLLATTGPMLWIYFVRMWQLPHYQYFPFVILAVLWLVWQRSDRRFYPPAGILSVLGLLTGGAALALGWSIRSPWLVVLAFVCFSAACLASMRGERDPSLLYLALPLLLLLRLPLSYDQLLVIQLQGYTTSLASVLLDVLSVPHTAIYNVLQLPDRELFVAEACSGIQSVFTLAFIASLIVVFKRRRLWLAPLYWMLSALLAVAGNVLRVTTVAAVAYWFDLDWASGWSHDLLGYTTLMIAGLFLLSFDQIIVGFLHPTIRSASAASYNPIVQAWNWCVDDGSTVNAADAYYIRAINAAAPPTKRNRRLGDWLEQRKSKPVFYATVILALAMTGVSVSRARLVTPLDFEGGNGMFVEGMIWAPTGDHFDEISNHFTLSNYESARDGEDPVLGNNADSWSYSRVFPSGETVHGQFTISQSYTAWHELCLCYEIRNWKLVNRKAHLESEEGSDLETTSYASALFSRENNHQGRLIYSCIDEAGRIVRPPPKPGRLRSRLDDAWDASETASDTMMMIQLWIVTGEKLEPEIQQAIARDFQQLQTEIAEEVGAPSGEGLQTGASS